MLLAVGCLAVRVPQVQAAPWQDLFKSRGERIAADDGRQYVLGEEHGPWLILATTFSGSQARSEAQKLVLELRRRYKLNAYLHERTYDYSRAVVGRGVDRYGDPKRMRYRRAVAAAQAGLSGKVDEIAVLVGDFTSVDDPLAQKTLKQLKRFKPECLADEQGTNVELYDQTGEVSLASFRSLIRRSQDQVGQSQQWRYTNRKQGLSRLSNAFLVPNPILPQEYFAPKGMDKFVYELNKNVEHSLMDCPGRYTVLVATFKGFSSVDQEQIDTWQSKEPRKSLPSKLDEAAEKAHLLTEALLAKGYEAYEFHDRKASMVCVGSFDSIGSQHPDGTIEVASKVRQIMKTFGAEQQMAAGYVTPMFGKPKTLRGLPFDLEPVPVEVPRRSIAADYEQPRRGTRQ
jgi:hypothetical protein